jgi:hypothetical protein
MVLPIGGNTSFESYGFAAGGVDPYFTLFMGSGGSATFLGSNFAQAFSTGGDFATTFDLPAGSYMLAIGAFANVSFTENLGIGTLADGFTALGGPSFLGNYYYEVNVSSAAPVPEPATSILISTGLVALYMRRRRAERSR